MSEEREDLTDLLAELLPADLHHWLGEEMAYRALVDLYRRGCLVAVPDGAVRRDAQTHGIVVTADDLRQWPPAQAKLIRDWAADVDRNIWSVTVLNAEGTLVDLVVTDTDERGKVYVVGGEVVRSVVRNVAVDPPFPVAALPSSLRP